MSTVSQSRILFRFQLLRLVPSLVPQLFAQARPHFANTIATSSTAFNHFVLRPLIQIPAWYFKTPQIFSTKTCQVDSFLGICTDRCQEFHFSCISAL
ncbi:hypothetical protein F5880DRAFT_912632 [Lentinula raphanica]|nr:hypothetical protein F5880DRAFT_912632 [Lentinula raphanica]